MFLTSLARNYGNNAAIIYYGFRIPLNSFGNNENINDTLLKFQYPGRHIVIGMQNQDHGSYFKTVSKA